MREGIVMGARGDMGRRWSLVLAALPSRSPRVPMSVPFRESTRVVVGGQVVGPGTSVGPACSGGTSSFSLAPCPPTSALTQATETVVADGVRDVVLIPFSSSAPSATSAF